MINRRRIRASLSISLPYREEGSGRHIRINVDSGHERLGSLRAGTNFWALPSHRVLGIDRLAEIGIVTPIFFYERDGLAALRRELRILDDNLASIAEAPAVKARRLSNLIYCYHLLVETAPTDSEPCFMVGE